MEEIISRIYVGADEDYIRLKTHKGWSFLRCCKDGPGSHREMLDYHTMAAPKGDNYLFVAKGNHAAMNCIDIQDVDFIPTEMITEGLGWARKRYDLGDKILFACNAGHSRGPTTCLMFMRAIGEMPHGYNESRKIFHKLYPPYDPEIGMKQKAHMLWKELPTLLKD